MIKNIFKPNKNSRDRGTSDNIKYFSKEFKPSNIVSRPFNQLYSSKDHPNLKHYLISFIELTMNAP